MPKIVILGSSRFTPYEILAVPNKIPEVGQTEEDYQKAFEIFKPAIESSDIVIVYAPDGIGKHTRRDLEYALIQGKRIIIIGKNSTREFMSNRDTMEIRG